MVMDSVVAPSGSPVALLRNNSVYVPRTASGLSVNVTGTMLRAPTVRMAPNWADTRFGMRSTTTVTGPSKLPTRSTIALTVTCPPRGTVSADESTVTASRSVVCCGPSRILSSAFVHPIASSASATLKTRDLFTATWSRGRRRSVVPCGQFAAKTCVQEDAVPATPPFGRVVPRLA